MQACHDATNDREGRVPKWHVTQLKCLRIPGPLAEAEADRVEYHQIVQMVQRSCPRHWSCRMDR
jgi:hypothetical protein